MAIARSSVKDNILDLQRPERFSTISKLLGKNREFSNVFPISSSGVVDKCFRGQASGGLDRMSLAYGVEHLLTPKPWREAGLDDGLKVFTVNRDVTSNYQEPRRVVDAAYAAWYQQDYAGIRQALRPLLDHPVYGPHAAMATADVYAGEGLYLEAAMFLRRVIQAGTGPVARARKRLEALESFTKPSNGSKELIIHIGYMKSASTFLQVHFFPMMSGVNYLGRHHIYMSFPGLGGHDSTARGYNPEPFMAEMRRISSSLGEEGLYRVAGLLAPRLWSNGPTLVSHEGIFNSMILQDPAGVRTIGRRIRKLADILEVPVKVVVVVRRQSDWIRSFYYALAASRGNKVTSLSPDDIIDWNGVSLKNINEMKLTEKIIPDIVKYDKLFEGLSVYIGRESLLFLPMEALVGGDDKAIGHLQRFISGKEHGDLTRYLQQASPVNVIGGRKHQDSPELNWHLQQAKQVFAEGNSKLEGHLPVSLQKYNYY